MTTQEILKRLSQGAVLCMEYTPEDNGKCYWLEPGRIIIRRDQAESLIGLLKPDEHLFDGAETQTWRRKA